jgi:hypothetical protein
MVVVYLVLVEVAKALFFRPGRNRLVRPSTTHAQRLERRIRRRAARFIRHPAVPGRQPAP